MTDNLLPCPFCGGEAGIGRSKTTTFVNCTDCLSSSNLLTDYNTSDVEAIKAWNTRTPAMPYQEAVEKVAEAIKRAWLSESPSNGELMTDCAKAALAALGIVEGKS